MTTDPTFRAPQRPVPPASPRRLAGWAGTLTRPGSGLGFWAAALSVQPGLALGAILLLALAAVLRAL